MLNRYFWNKGWDKQTTKKINKDRVTCRRRRLAVFDVQLFEAESLESLNDIRRWTWERRERRNRKSLVFVVYVIKHSLLVIYNFLFIKVGEILATELVPKMFLSLFVWRSTICDDVIIRRSERSDLPQGLLRLHGGGSAGQGALQQLRRHRLPFMPRFLSPSTSGINPIKFNLPLPTVYNLFLIGHPRPLFYFRSFK